VEKTTTIAMAISILVEGMAMAGTTEEVVMTEEWEEMDLEVTATDMVVAEVATVAVTVAVRPMVVEVT